MPSPVRIVTFNIRRDSWADGANRWRRRRDAVTAVLREADVVGLQEARHRQLRDCLLGAPGHRWVGAGRDDGGRRGEHVPVLWRADRFECVDAGHFWLSSEPDRPGSRDHPKAITRMATWARLRDTAVGTRLFVVNTHLDHRVEQARLDGMRQVRAVVDDRAADDPVVLLGDLNARPGSATLDLALDPSAGRVVLRDARHLAAHPPEGPEGTLNGWGRRDDGPRIDYVLLSDHWTVERYAVDAVRVDGRAASDHDPVRVSAFTQSGM